MYSIWSNGWYELEKELKQKSLQPARIESNLWPNQSKLVINSNEPIEFFGQIWVKIFWERIVLVLV